MTSRNALALHSQSDDDDDDHGHGHRTADGRDELVHELSGADFTGARKKEQQKTLVIPLIKKNHWRNTPEGAADEADRASETRASSAPQAPTPPGGASHPVDLPDPQPAAGKGWGLQVMKKRAPEVATPELSTIEAMDTVTTTENIAAPQTVEEEAAAAVLREAMDDGSSAHNAVSYLPLIAQNVVPGLAELTDPVHKYRHDVAQRPDELAMDDYTRVPIEEFGTALLRGMGWENGRPVGKNPRGLTEPISLKSRPHLLGLGATPAPVLEPKIKKFIKPGEKRAVDPLAEAPSRPGSTTDSPRISRRGSPYSRPEPSKASAFRVGDRVSILAGRHKGSTGAISEIKARDSGTVIKVALADGEVGRVWPQDLAPATSSSADRVASSQSASWLRPNIRVVGLTLPRTLDVLPPR
ncbi:hypothetical protein HDU87_004517 [Geranomyces variabilis]|uniref:G-patch domain-containing protein n=1 Tax=Geranomyces variabilis TaxID=109894 RepID=A0AAD5TIP0_9FUNG|nr:hypothetical protein HDU87_004517 [Geranomyces variabilis]